MAYHTDCPLTVSNFVLKVYRIQLMVWVDIMKFDLLNRSAMSDLRVPPMKNSHFLVAMIEMWEIKTGMVRRNNRRQGEMHGRRY